MSECNDCEALRAELEALGIFSPPAPRYEWTIAGIALALALGGGLGTVALTGFATAIPENWDLIFPSVSPPLVLNPSTFAAISGNLAQAFPAFTGRNRYTNPNPNQYDPSSRNSVGDTFALSPEIIQAFYESPGSRTAAQQLLESILSHFNEDQLALMHLISEGHLSGTDSWNATAAAVSFLRRLSEGEDFRDDSVILREAEAFFGTEFYSMLESLGDPRLSYRWQDFPVSAYPAELQFLTSVDGSANPELFALAARWYALDESARDDALTLIERISAIPVADYPTSLEEYDAVMGAYGLPNLLHDFASSPYLLEQLAAAEGGNQSLYALVMADPSLITSLAASPTFTQVLSEMFADETLQQTFAQELFGDIEEADNPIRAAIASAFGDLADEDNPIAQQLVQGVLGAVDPENPGSSLGGAVRQVVQDVLDTPETGVIPRLNRLETTLESVNTQLLLVSTGLTRLREELAAMLSSTDRRAEHNPKLPWQPVITEG